MKDNVERYIVTVASIVVTAADSSNELSSYCYKPQTIIFKYPIYPLNHAHTTPTFSSFPLFHRSYRSFIVLSTF